MTDDNPPLTPPAVPVTTTFAVTGLRFDSSPVGNDGLVEVVAYGTAVTI